jgi:hypothetical protein
MKTVKTARGAMLDMGALSTKFERERAVSNVPVNARGDIIDSRGAVKVPKEKVAKEFYKNSVPGAETQVSIKTDSSDQPAPTKSTKATKATEPTEVTEVSRRVRTRDDGSQYAEVEFSDGSMTVQEIG